jgi:thiamine-phosphate pyrophosphorylase
VVTQENAKRTHEEIAEQSYIGGADVVQLRDKNMNSLEYFKTAMKISVLAKEYGKLFIVNDRIDIALASDADGVHLGQSDIPAKAARRIVPEDMIIGVSVGNAKEAKEAEKAKADYVALSPIFDTLSKGDAGSGKGMEMLFEIRNAVNIPVIAIGGINESNAFSVIEGGADGIAVISAVTEKEDMAQAVRNLKEIVKEAKSRR